MEKGEAAAAEEEEREVMAGVRAQGGAAYSVASAAGDWEVAADMAWEQLHASPWHSVHDSWRDAFALAALRLHPPSRPLLDTALLLGAPRLRRRLLAAIAAEAPPPPPPPLPSPSPSPSPSLLPPIFGGIPRLPLLPVEDFLCSFFLPRSPALISGAMSHWPALIKWRDPLAFFSSAPFAHRTVPIEVGEHYLAPGWKQELMTMLDFLRRVSSHSASQRPYLAQHPLFEQIPELQNDICIPDYCEASGGGLKSVNAWLGPQGTVSPLHHDPHHNLLCQVVGRKYVRLYSPDASEALYPFEETMLQNSSQVDLDNPDYSKFPLAENLPFVDCILEEGEMLYIPPKWWHYVKSLSLSVSVSFWWSGSEEDE